MGIARLLGRRDKKPNATDKTTATVAIAAQKHEAAAERVRGALADLLAAQDGHKGVTR